MKYHNDPSKLVIHDKLVKRQYYYNGMLSREQYFLNGVRHNPNGSAHRSWYEDGQLMREEYYLNDRVLSKEEHARLTQNV